MSYIVLTARPQPIKSTQYTAIATTAMQMHLHFALGGGDSFSVPMEIAAGGEIVWLPDCAVSGEGIILAPMTTQVRQARGTRGRRMA